MRTRVVLIFFPFAALRAAGEKAKKKTARYPTLTRVGNNNLCVVRNYALFIMNATTVIRMPPDLAHIIELC